MLFWSFKYYLKYFDAPHTTDVWSIANQTSSITELQKLDVRQTIQISKQNLPNQFFLFKYSNYLFLCSLSTGRDSLQVF